MAGPSADVMGPPATRIVVAALAVAGGVHVGVALQHGVTTRHGVFFLLLGLVQGALTALVLRRASPCLLAIIVSVSTAAVAVWAATRLSEVGHRETVGVLGLTAAGLELLTIGAGLSLLRGPVQPHPLGIVWTPVLLVAATLAAMGTHAVPSPHAHHHHGHDSRAESAHHQSRAHTERADAENGPTIDEPIFGDLFTDHHAEPETTRDEHPDGVEPHPPVDDGATDAEPHEHPPGDDHAEHE